MPVACASRKLVPNNRRTKPASTGPFMALTKSLSNPVGPLKTLLEGLPQPPLRRSAQPGRAGRAIAARHPRAGRIIEAIVQVLTDRQEPMQAKEVHAAVESLLGESVRWASVKAALAANVAGSSPRFVRVARGRYALR